MSKPNANYSSVIVCPETIPYKGTKVSVLNVPFKAKFLEVVDGGGTLTHLTLGEYEVQGGFEFPRSEDGRYIALFVELSDLSNENALFKGLLTDCGVSLGGGDFTQSGTNLAWLLTLHEFVNEFKPVSPLFKTADEA